MAKTPSRVAASAPKSSKAQPKNPRKSQTLLELLSRAERELVESSNGKKLAALTEKELKRFTTRARGLYQKWSDQLRGQSRSVKAGNRQAASTANARTSDKVTMLAEALGRFEARLEEITASVIETVTGPPATKKKASKKSAKKVAKKASRPSTTASPRAKKAKAREAVAADPGQLVRTDRNKQRKAKTAATKAVYKTEGLTTRRTQSAASTTRRNQARRDSK